MNIGMLLSTKERRKILGHVVYRAEYLSVSVVSRELSLSKSLISKYFDCLCKEGILKRSSGKFVVQTNMVTRALKILLNLNVFDTDFFKKHTFVKSAGLYGSFAKGTNTEDSDIDLWVYIDKAKEEEIAKLTSELKKRFGNIRPLYLTKEKICMLKDADVPFYYSLLFGSLTVYGAEIQAV